MASIKSRLKKYATLGYVHELITDPTKVKAATRDGAGLMSPDHVRKLDRIEDNATGDMTAAEIVASLIEVKDTLPLDVKYLGGKAADDYAHRDHYHDDRYMPRAQTTEALVELSRQLGAFMQEVQENFGHLQQAVALVAQGVDMRVTIAAFEKQLAAVDAVKVGGKSLEDLDHRYDTKKDAAPTVAHSGGVVRGGQYSPDPSKGSLFRYVNGGNHIFAVPASKNDYELKVAITHGKDAGRIDFEGGKVFYGEHHVGETTLVVVTKIGSYIDVEVR